MAERNERVFERVRQELAKNPGLGSRDLYQMAQRADGSIAGDSLQQFHARYVLPLKREAAASKGKARAKRGRRPGPAKAPTTAAARAPRARRRGRPPRPEGSDRERVRAALLRFAQDFSGAETKSEIVKVMSKLDDYVNQILPAE